MPLTKDQVDAALAANENCLEGMVCPNCGQYERFDITMTVTATVRVHDNGHGSVEGDTEYDSDSFCGCPECNHTGTVKDFTIEDNDYGDDS